MKQKLLNSWYYLKCKQNRKSCYMGYLSDRWWKQFGVKKKKNVKQKQIKEWKPYNIYATTHFLYMT